MNHPTLVRPVPFVVGVVFVAIASLSGTALAEDRASGPTPEVYAACTSKTEGNACTLQVKGGHGTTFQGVCSPDRQTQKLACRPNPPKPRS
jgi:hypothetical protein